MKPNGALLSTDFDKRFADAKQNQKDGKNNEKESKKLFCNDWTHGSICTMDGACDAL